MTVAAGGASGLGWLLDNLVERVPEIEHAVVLSADGLLIASSSGLSRSEGEHLSAVASGFNSLARGVGQQFAGGAVRQTVIEMENAFLFVMAAGTACLTVVGDAKADVGLVVYEMALLVVRVGEFLTPGVRAGTRD